MLILLSPAKKLLNIPGPYVGQTSQPLFSNKTAILTEVMRAKSVQDIADLMDLSSALATLNFERYQNFNKQAAYPALFLFQGDVYQGLQANTLAPDAIDYAQSHLRILSGLYGFLKPLDSIQPYRLEMGVRLENPEGKNLYHFWQETLTHALNEELSTQKNPLLINLASTEYFKVINQKQINYPIQTINFYENKNGQLKMVGIHAKKARGVMARFLIEHQIDNLEQVKDFSLLGYRYHPETSSNNHLDFIR